MKYKKRSYLDFKNLDRLTDTLANLLENISMAIDDKKPVRTKFNPEEFDKIEYLDPIKNMMMPIWTYEDISFGGMSDLKAETKMVYNRCNKGDFHVFVNVSNHEKLDYPYHNYREYLASQISHYTYYTDPSVMMWYFEHATDEQADNLNRFISHAKDAIEFFKEKLNEAEDESNYGKAYIVDSLNLTVTELTKDRAKEELALICYDYLEKEFQKRGVDKFIDYIEVPMITYTDGAHIRIYPKKDIDKLYTLIDFGNNMNIKDFTDNGYLKYIPVLYGNKPFPNTTEVNTNIFKGYVPLAPKTEDGVLDAYLYLGLDDSDIIEELNATISEDRINIEDIKAHPTIFHIFK